MAIRTVIRILEYTGPEEWLEATFAANRVPLQGERKVGPVGTIKSGTVRWSGGQQPADQGETGGTDVDMPPSVIAAEELKEPLRLPRPGGG